MLKPRGYVDQRTEEQKQEDMDKVIKANKEKTDAFNENYKRLFPNGPTK